MAHEHRLLLLSKGVFLLCGKYGMVVLDDRKTAGSFVTDNKTNKRYCLLKAV